MTQGGGKELGFHPRKNIPQSPVRVLTDALEMHTGPPSSAWYSLSYLVLKKSSTALLLFDGFIFYATITTIYFHTWKHIHIAKETLQRSEADLSGCSLRSRRISPDCTSYNTENQGMVITGHSIFLANLCMLLISALPSRVFKSWRQVNRSEWTEESALNFKGLKCAVRSISLGPGSPLLCHRFPAWISQKPVVLTQDPPNWSLEFLLLFWKHQSPESSPTRCFA